MNQPILNQEIFNLLRSSCESSDQVFLVGGAVRDWWLGLVSKDIDIVIKGDVFSFAKNFANKIKGDFYLMDEEHEVIRVLRHERDHKNIFDFSKMRGDCLEDDLKYRDFTMNAMAIDLEKPDTIIDPLNGRDDLRRKNLKSCSNSSLKNDPIRIIRAVRFAFQFNLQIGEELSNQISQLIELLHEVSKERIRDEIFHIFNLENTTNALLRLEQLGILEIVIPELKNLQGIEQSHPHTMDVWSHSISTLEWGEKILIGLNANPDMADHPLASIIHSLEKYNSLLRKVFSRPILEGRSRISLLKMGMILHDIAKPETRTLGDDGRYHFYGHHINGLESMVNIGKKLALSNNEIDYLGILIRNHMLIHWLCKEGGHLSRRAIYRYFSRTQEFGIDICILSLADLLAKSNRDILEEKLRCELIAISELLNTWIHDFDAVIDPPLLLNGHEVMSLLSIQGNPDVGELLDALKESQAAGEVTDKQEAMKFVHEVYGQMKHQKDRTQ